MLNSYLSITYVFPRHRPKQPPSRGSTAPKSVMGIQRDLFAILIHFIWHRRDSFIF